MDECDLPKDVLERIDQQVAEFRRKRVAIECRKIERTLEKENNGGVPYRVKETLDYFERGMTTEEIANLMDIQENTVIVHLRKAGKWKNPKDRKYFEERNKRISEEMASGKSLRDIGKQFGISGTAVKSALFSHERKIKRDR